jgi:hypothetical protein
MLTDLEPVYAVGDLAVRSRLLDAKTEVSMLQRDAPLVSARRIYNLTVWDEAVRVDPVAPSPTIRGRRVVDLLALASLLRW